jgi:anti-anti-sigma factor
VKAIDIQAVMIDRIAVATLVGDIDMLNGEGVGQELLRIGLTSSIGLVTDLNGIRYADSAGVRVLFTLKRQLAQARLGLAVAISEEAALRRLLKVTNFDEIVPTLPSIDSAVAQLNEL